MYTPEHNLAMLNEIYADAIAAERRDA